MKIGIIGVGIVGGTLAHWLESNTEHEIVKLDPLKNLNDDLTNSDAIFICIPVKPSNQGQDQVALNGCVRMAKSFSDKVFIRSTVLMGTNDHLGTISCPEFLTARIAQDEMNRLDILVGDCDPNFIQDIFRGKKIKILRNAEAELAKLAHNCFGAIKVTYFNMIYKLSQDLGLDYENVKEGFLSSGFINEPHTKVPGPDGRFGYGGSCFPENMDAFDSWLTMNGYNNFRGEYAPEFDLCSLIEVTSSLNASFRQGIK